MPLDKRKGSKPASPGFNSKVESTLEQHNAATFYTLLRGESLHQESNLGISVSSLATTLGVFSWGRDVPTTTGRRLDHEPV